MKQVFNTKKLEETQEVAKDLASKILSENCCPKAKQAIVIGLSGDLGAGKTSFAQGFAKALGINNPITSPTFVLMKNYMLPVTGYPLRKFIHIDAYRLKGAEDMQALDWKEMINDPKNIIMIEWPENIKGAMPKNTIWIKFEHENRDSRKITIQ